MSLNPNSTFKTIKKGGPFQSRSVIVCIICLITLTGINIMAVYTGFFNEAFALVSVYLIKDILVAVFGHQTKTEENKPESDKTTISIPASNHAPIANPS